MSKAFTHLDSIDFVKGLAAISVILLHTLPGEVLRGTLAIYHIWQAVPIFIFLSFFLGFRHLEKTGDTIKAYYSKKRMKKLFMRVWLPLIILAVFESILFLGLGDNNRALRCLLCYGNGPGKYYIWCYMQIWLLIPIIFFLLKKMGILTGGSILLIISTLLCFVYEKWIGHSPGYSCFRYLFLGVPAYIYIKGVNIKKIMPFVVLSMIYLWVMRYIDVPEFADPFLPDGWEIQTSLAFFYTLFLFMLLLKLFDRLEASKIKDYIIHLGKISWEVFIVQMVLIGTGVLDYVGSRLFHASLFHVGFKVIAALVITLSFAELYNRFLNSVIHIKNEG